MPRTCTVCVHSERSEIDHALLAGKPFRNIAKRYGTSPTALFRHKQQDIPVALVKAKEAAAEVQADSLFDRLKGLAGEARAILEEARASKNHAIALHAIGRAAKLLELEARLLGELDDSVKVAVGVSVEPERPKQDFSRLTDEELQQLRALVLKTTVPAD